MYQKLLKSQHSTNQKFFLLASNRYSCIKNCNLFSTTLSTDEWPSATKLISLEKVNLKCDSSEIVDKIK